MDLAGRGCFLMGRRLRRVGTWSLSLVYVMFIE